MTTLDLHDQLRSLLADIGDAAGEPRGLRSANGSRSRLPAPRPRAGRLLAAAAAVVLVVAGAIAVWQHTPSSDTSGDGISVAPVVAEWLDVVAAPYGTALVPGSPVRDPGTACRRVQVTASGDVCSALEGSIVTSYQRGAAVIVITTVYTQEPVSSYASEVAASIGGSVELTPVVTRGRAASRIDGPRPTIVWTERFGVIGRLEMSPGSSTDDLVGLADTLMTRPWAWPVPVVATARAACGPVDSGFDIPPGIAPGYTTGYFRKCDLDWSRHFIRADMSGGFPIEVFATRTSTKAIAWFYPDCAGLPEGFAPVGSPPLKRCSANTTATTAAAKN